MDSQYGIAVRNKFDLFLDEDADPLEILRLQEEEKNKKKDEVVKGKDPKSLKDSKSAKNKKNKAQTTVQDQKPKPVEVKESKKDDKAPRNKSRNDDRPNRPPRENRERDLPPRRQQQDKVDRPVSSGFGAPATSPQSNEFNRTEGGRGRGGDRRGRGGRGGSRGRGGYDRFGKREFERHSGSDKTSGIKPTEKREGGGAHNWGNVKDDIDDQINTTEMTEQNQEWAAQSEDVENQKPIENAEDDESAPQEEDPSVSEMTLDEWKELQRKEKLSKESFNVRKAGEGCDNSQWKKTYMLKKKPEQSDDEEDDEDDEDYEDERRKKAFVPIEITFADAPRRGGGRGGGRGGRGRGGGFRGSRGAGGRGGGGGSSRGGGKKEQAPNVEDEQDFPSLSKPTA